MWILIECDDPAIGPGHDEKRRFILPDDFTLTMETMSKSLPVTFQFGSEMHPCTPGDDGYHCPICHKDIPPTDEYSIDRTHNVTCINCGKTAKYDMTMVAPQTRCKFCGKSLISMTPEEP